MRRSKWGESGTNKNEEEQLRSKEGRERGDEEKQMERDWNI